MSISIKKCDVDVCCVDNGPFIVLRTADCNGFVLIDDVLASL